MKLGTENKKKTIAAVTVLAAAVVFLIWSLSGGSPAAPKSETGRAATSSPAGGTPPGHRTQNTMRHYLALSLPPTLDPRLRLDLLQDSEGLAYEGKGRNVFQEQMEDIVPSADGSGLRDGGKQPPKGRTPWVPPAPTPAPPINLKFYGWASKPGEPKAIFLAQGNNSYVAYEGDIVARRYKVLKIGSNSVEVEDVLSNNRQNLPLGLGQ